MAKHPKLHVPDSAPQRVSDALRIPAGPVDISALDPRATPGYVGKGKGDAPKLTAILGPKISNLQERLFADGKGDPDNARSVLVVLQGMDTSGKGGIIRHVFGMADPQGIALKAFKAPTAEERAHDFLWRIENALPGKGMIGIFDRSQYEDVLIVRVDNIVPPEVWGARYDQINEWEAKVAASGTRIVKCFLNVSKDEQKERLEARLADPAKHWKYNPGDVDVRNKWNQYMEAYTAALESCNTDDAPWYHIPADRKWYRNWAVATILAEQLDSLDPQWPKATFDVEAEKARVEAS